MCFRDGRAFLFLLRRRAPRRPSTRRFAKLFYPPREQSVASLYTTDLDMVAYHIFRSNDRHMPTATQLQNITDHSHADGPASTTNNSHCAWPAIVSARSKGSPRQKAPTQSRSSKRLPPLLRKSNANEWHKRHRNKEET